MNEESEKEIKRRIMMTVTKRMIRMMRMFRMNMTRMRKMRRMIWQVIRRMISTFSSSSSSSSSAAILLASLAYNHRDEKSIKIFIGSKRKNLHLVISHFQILLLFYFLLIVQISLDQSKQDSFADIEDVHYASKTDVDKRRFPTTQLSTVHSLGVRCGKVDLHLYVTAK